MVLTHDFSRFPELTNNQLSEFLFSSPFPQILDDFSALVTKVTDGDTIRVKADFRDFDFPVRFLEIDAKELSEGGSEAKDWLSARILNKEVLISINKDNRVDKWGRLLGSVTSDGLSITDELLNLGLAIPFDSRNDGKIIDPIKEVFV